MLILKCCLTIVHVFHSFGQSNARSVEVSFSYVTSAKCYVNRILQCILTMNLSQLLFVLFCCGTLSCGYKILGIFPHSGKSHFDVFKPLLKALAKKGHELHVISYFPLGANTERYHDISLLESREPLLHFFDVDAFKGYKYEQYLSPLILSYFGYKSCSDGLAAKAVQDFMKKNHTFDLIITEYFNTDCYLGFAHKYKVPIVSLSSCTMMPWLNARYGNPDNPSYIPNNLMDFSDQMTFIQRVENTLAYILHQLIYYLLMDIPGNIIARKHFGEDLPALSDIVYNTSIVLINTHFSLNLPRPQTPNVIDVGGIHIENVKTLPKVCTFLFSLLAINL